MTKTRIDLFSVSTFLVFVLSFIEETIPYGQVLTLASLILMVISCVDRKKNTFFLPLRSGYLIYLYAFFLFCVMSMLWAEDPTRTIVIVRGMIIILIEMTVIYSCHFNCFSLDRLLKSILYGGYTVIIYAILRYGWSTILYSLSEDMRISNQVLNANTIGMCAAYSIVVNFYYIIYEKLKATDVLIVLATFSIAASGSRKAIVIVIVGVLMLIFFRNLQNKSLADTLITGTVGLTGAVGIMVVLSRLEVFKVLKTRMAALWSVISGTAERGTTGYIRMVYNQTGIELFKEHPVLGIGLHNGSRYIGHYYGHVHFHNNFVELLACGGIIGFLFYYSMYIYLFAAYLLLFKARTREYDICFTLMFIRFAMGYGHIQYYQIGSYFYLMVFFLYIIDLRNRINNPCVQEGMLQGA